MSPVPGLPHQVSIQLYQSDGSTPRSGATLTLTNQNTGESVTLTTNTNGRALYELLNLTQGFSDGDKITVVQEVSADDVEFFITANGDDTVPTWTQVDNLIRTRIKLNSARFRLNTSRREGGISDINITRT